MKFKKFKQQVRLGILVFLTLGSMILRSQNIITSEIWQKADLTQEQNTRYE